MPSDLSKNFRVDNYAMRYSIFVPRLFNLCLSLGMRPNRIMPSRAFCSDENQGYPIILIAKHFATFPFNHGRVGGIVALDRHGPHSHHGHDMVIIQASHVGYEPDTGEFGIYRRLQTENHEHSSDCGAICKVLGWYRTAFDFACRQIMLERRGKDHVVIIDNQLLRTEREEGLFLNLERLIDSGDGHIEPLFQLSTAKAFHASPRLVSRIGAAWPESRESIERHFTADLFYFKRDTEAVSEASHSINRNLIKSMPAILTHKYPALAAAQVNAQVEFDRTFRSIVSEPAYYGKKVLFISGIHIDVSPKEGQIFPLTKYVPWAAYIQNEKGEGYILEQEQLFHALEQQSTDNPHKIDLTEAIGRMKQETEIRLHVDEE